MDVFDIKEHLTGNEYDRIIKYINQKSKSNTIDHKDITAKIDTYNKKWPFDNIILPEPTEYKIATQSAKYSLSHTINLEKLINILKNKMTPSYFVKGIIYKNNIYGDVDKKVNSESQVNNNRKNKMFDNQATLIIWSTYSQKNINLKLFINGSGSMTGCKHIKDGDYILDKLINEINEYGNELIITETDTNTTTTTTTNTELNSESKKGITPTIKLTNYAITMMKSDFELRVRVNRTELRNILLEKYKILAVFDPTIYPGVKICYMWNQNNRFNDGVCHCNAKCRTRSKKKSGIGEGECITVTIIVFEKGKVVITGARNDKHINDSYIFINKIVNTHKNKIVVNNII